MRSNALCFSCKAAHQLPAPAASPGGFVSCKQVLDGRPYVSEPHALVYSQFALRTGRIVN